MICRWQTVPLLPFMAHIGHTIRIWVPRSGCCTDCYKISSILSFTVYCNIITAIILSSYCNYYYYLWISAHVCIISQTISVGLHLHIHVEWQYRSSISIIHCRLLQKYTSYSLLHCIRWIQLELNCTDYSTHKYFYGSFIGLLYPHVVQPSQPKSAKLSPHTCFTSQSYYIRLSQ